MNLTELINRHAQRPAQGVPDWLTGCFRRHIISFADGNSDDSTRVFWLQSRNLTIDLRLPQRDPVVQRNELHLLDRAALRELANMEGWIADSQFHDGVMDWQNFTSFQLHNRWQEPARLHRVGNCMIEFAPSGAYVEDWRLQPAMPGPLVGLRLLEARNHHGELVARGGGLIICGDHAGWVQGRPTTLPCKGAANALRDAAMAACGDADALAPLFQFETSVATGSLERGYRVLHSTQPWRHGATLLDLNGFSAPDSEGRVRQDTLQDGAPITRWFAIDTLEARQDYRLSSHSNDDSRRWFDQEAETLTRYTRPLI